MVCLSLSLSKSLCLSHSLSPPPLNLGLLSVGTAECLDALLLPLGLLVVMLPGTQKEREENSKRQERHRGGDEAFFDPNGGGDDAVCCEEAARACGELELRANSRAIRSFRGRTVEVQTVQRQGAQERRRRRGSTIERGSIDEVHGGQENWRAKKRDLR